MLNGKNRRNRFKGQEVSMRGLWMLITEMLPYGECISFIYHIIKLLQRGMIFLFVFRDLHKNY